MPPAPKPAARTFRAPLEHGDKRLGWVIVRIPIDVHKIWKTRGRLKVKGEINGFPFRTSLFATGAGGHMMLVNKRMQAGAQAGLGTVARFRLEPDTEVRTVTVPVELERALAEDRAVRRWFDQLSYSMRKWMADSIADVKSPAARERRAGQIAERLLAAMEAERELPPILQAAFARDPRALAGWKRMSRSHRRTQLLAIFYYQSPEARARRVAKLIADARK